MSADSLVIRKYSRDNQFDILCPQAEALLAGDPEMPFLHYFLVCCSSVGLVVIFEVR